MSETWSKVRSFVRGAFVAQEVPSATEASLREPGERRASAPPIGNAVYRDVTSPAEPVGEQVRAVELKTDAVRARLDALEARLREHPIQPMGASASSVSEQANDERFAAISGEVAILRESLADLIKQQVAVKELAEELARHVADLGNAMTLLDKQVHETTRDVRDAQASADEALENAEVSRSEMQSWAVVRGREVGQRVAPLYVLTLVALLTALGAAGIAVIAMID